MSSAPIKKLPTGPRVGLSRVPVTNRGGEKVDVVFSDFGAGSGDQLRDPRLRSAGNDRKFSLGNECHFANYSAYNFARYLALMLGPPPVFRLAIRREIDKLK
jgi:hypothetical protein